MFNELGLGSPEASRGLASLLGTDEQKAGSAANAALPAIVGGLLGRTSKPEGASALFDLIGTNDGSVLDNVGGFLSGGNAGIGSSLLGAVLGSRRGAVEQGLSQSSGLDMGTIGRLLPMLAPLVMGWMGRKRARDGMDQAGMLSALADQRAGMERDGLGAFTALADGGTDEDDAGFASTIRDLLSSGGGTTGKVVAGAAAAAGAVAAGGAVGKVTAGRVTEQVKLGGGDNDRNKKGFPWWILGLVAAAIILALILSQCLGNDSSGTETIGSTVAESATATTAVTEATETTEAIEEEAVRTTEAAEEAASPTTTVVAADAAETNTLVDVATNAGNFKTLLAAAGTAGLADILQGDGPLTVFAPDDAAFGALPDGAIDGLDQATLKKILESHIVPGEAISAEKLKTLSEVTMASGETFPVTVEGDVVKVGDATVKTVDLGADNGVIHVLDGVILPEGVTLADSAAAPATLNEQLDLDPITFDVNSANITTEGQAVLDKAVEYFTTNSDQKSEVAGHTDSDGNDAANLDLSQRRADAVKKYLVDNGVNDDLLTTKGYGETELIKDGDVENKDKSRRIEFRLL